MTSDISPSLSALKAKLTDKLSAKERTAIYQEFLTIEQERILGLHRSGASGLEVCKARSELLDDLLAAVYDLTTRTLNLADEPIALIAIGGYGRGVLNPGSDIDLLMLLPKISSKLTDKVKELVQQILYPLWDVGFKVGHATRSVAECIDEAKADQQSFTALMDTRLIAGNRELYDKLLSSFDKYCSGKGLDTFLEARKKDLRSRYNKSYHTVFLQEPNVKESCGGLRDYHNILWIARVKTGSNDLSRLVDERIITPNTLREIEEANSFLLRVRNELHYHSGRSTDILTLQLQGVVATAFNYPQKSILRRTEEFMRDYYRHTRHLFRHTTSIMESFEISQNKEADSGFVSFLSFRKKKKEKFDGFVSIGDRIFPENLEIFIQDPHRLMRMFQHCQLRRLRMSPQMRRLVANHWHDIDEPFRYLKANRDTFQAILERKGQVSETLRQMHRIGFLGRYLPEFGALDCLVQHEFFHRYTADEHTLRCIDELDKLIENDNPQFRIFQSIFRKVADPYALYLALILHDTGRSEDVREHIDGSAMLATDLCARLQIKGRRRALIMFLVDNHLIFWRTATTKNLEDPEVIAEFAAVMKTTENLDTLLLFTFCDTNGTAPDAWNGWKESLMLQLHRATKHFLEEGREGFNRRLDEERKELKAEVIAQMPASSKEDIKEHFARTPDTAFAYSESEFITAQIEAVQTFLAEEAGAETKNAFCLNWLDHPDRGYSELVLATRDQPLLLEKLCCALASEEINILSADLLTRTDDIVMNIFRVCTTDFEPVSNKSSRSRITGTFTTMLENEEYNPSKFLKRKTNFLKAKDESLGVPVPVRAHVSNDVHPNCTTVDIQALDRIGLLHDLFLVINQAGLDTTHARICTEKGVAMDTLYITTQDDRQIEDPELLRQLQSKFGDLIGIPEKN